MKRYDNYGLNKDENWLYNMAITITREINKNNITKQIIDEAIEEAIELGLNRRITNDFDINLVKGRLYNWYAVN